jgi:hypothetical protein
MNKTLKAAVLLILVVAVTLGVSSIALGGKTPPAPATTPVFKLLAERNLTPTEAANPAAAVAATTLKLMAYIDKSGASWKVVPNGNSPDGRSLKMPSPGPGIFIQIVEVYSSSVDACMLQAEGGRMTVAIPWEYAIYTDGSGKIRVNMLVPSGVTKLMMLDPTCVQPAAISAEDNLTKFAVNALAKSGWSFPKTYMDPKLTEEEVAMARSMVFAPEIAIAVPGNKTPTQFTAEVRDSIKNAVNAQVLVLPQGWHVQRVVDYTGGPITNHFSLELCSPYYAAQALSMGAHHAPALPCQVGVWYDGSKVRVSVLDPNFIFGFFFRDALATMTPEQMEQFSQLPPIVMAEICAMVNTGIAPFTGQRF